MVTHLEPKMLSKINLVLLVLLTQSITHTLLKGQVINACDFRVDQLGPCLSMQEKNTSENEVCCNALSLAISAGYRCFCSILSSPNLNFMASISPLLNLSLELPFLGCHLASPSLSVCQGSYIRLFELIICVCVCVYICDIV